MSINTLHKGDDDDDDDDDHDDDDDDDDDDNNNNNNNPCKPALHRNRLFNQPVYEPERIQYYFLVPIGHHARYCSTHISQFPYHGVPGTGVLETGLDLSCAFCNSLARSSSSDFFLASSSSTTIFSSFSLSLSGSLVASPLVTAGWVGGGWLCGSASPSDNSLGLTEAEGGPAELVMVETPCAAASFAAAESKTNHIIINVPRAFHELMGIHHQCREQQHIFNSRLPQMQ